MLTKVSSIGQRFLDYLEKHGPSTTEQFEQACKVLHQSMGSVTKPLEANKQIAKTGKKAPTASGGEADLWDLYERVTGKPSQIAKWLGV